MLQELSQAKNAMWVPKNTDWSAQTAGLAVLSAVLRGGLPGDLHAVSVTTP